jgi:hypothetical protein
MHSCSSCAHRSAPSYSSMPISSDSRTCVARAGCAQACEYKAAQTRGGCCGSAAQFTWSAIQVPVTRPRRGTQGCAAAARAIFTAGSLSGRWYPLSARLPQGRRAGTLPGWSSGASSESCRSARVRGNGQRLVRHHPAAAHCQAGLGTIQVRSGRSAGHFPAASKPQRSLPGPVSCNENCRLKRQTNQIGPGPGETRSLNPPVMS